MSPGQAPLPNRHQYRFLAAVLFGVPAAYLALRFGAGWYLNEGSRTPGDFLVYWRAAERLVAGESIYVPEDPSPYKYSLVFAWFFRVTFFLLEQKLAAATWMMLSVLAFFGALTVFVRPLFLHARFPFLVAWNLAGAIALSWSALLETLSYGQIDLFLGAGVLCAFSVSRPILRALLWSAVLAVKPHLGLVFLALAVTMGIRQLAAVAVATASVYLLPAIWIGPSAWITSIGEWIACLQIQQDAVFMTSNLNASFGAVLARITQRPQDVAHWTVAGFVFFIATVVHLARLKPREESLSFKFQALSLGLAGYLLFSPLSWRWVAFLWIPIVASYAAFGRVLTKLGFWFTLAFVSATGLLGLLDEESLHYWGVRTWASLALLVIVADGRFVGARGQKKDRSP